MKHRVLFIVGPTAIGKTDLSIELAKRLDAEIVSADSRQVYKLMNIGTAKPTAEQLATIAHHFIDHKFPDEYYSAGEFGREARHCIAEMQARAKTAMVVGGSGLYIRGLVEGFFEPKLADAEVKERLKREATEYGIASMHTRLSKLDPETAQRIHGTDSQRILRALEVYELTGRPYSEFLQIRPQPAKFEPCFVGLTMGRAALYARIEKRVDLMLRAGLVDEVKDLRRRGYSPELNALQTVGYKEVFAYLNDEIGYEAVVDLIKQKTRNYAKRQFTWFRKDKRIHWLELDADHSWSDALEVIQGIYAGEEERVLT